MNNLLDKAFYETEKFSAALGLTPREESILRLLTEEMVSMTEHLVDAKEQKFFIKNEARLLELHLIVDANISPEKKKEFLTASKDGKNKRAKGLMGKLMGVVEDFFYLDENETALSLGMNGFIVGELGYQQYWSMVEYMNTAPKKQQQDDWDGLEKSILMNFSDDIIIGASTQQVEIVVKKQF